MAKASKPEPEVPSTNDYAESFFKEHAEDLFNHITPLNKPISSGSLILDQYVKARSGGVIRLTAKTPELGKTSQGFVYLAEYMKAMGPKAKAAYVMAEGRLSPEIKARSGLTFVYHPRDWTYGTVLVLATNVFEPMAEFIVEQSKRMFEAGEKLVIMIDSLDGLILKVDKDTKGVTDGKVAGVPKLTKLLFRHVALPITFYDIFLIITSQYSADISIDQYAPKIPRLGEASGGSSVPHQCDYILQYLPRYGGDYILEDPEAKPDPIKNKIIGVWAKVEIKKSASDTTGTKVEIPIKKGRIGSAIWVEKEVGDMVLTWQLYKKSGAWLTLDTNHPFNEAAKKAKVVLKEKIQGINNLYDYIETDRAVFECLFEQVKQRISGGETE